MKVPTVNAEPASALEVQVSSAYRLVMRKTTLSQQLHIVRKMTETICHLFQDNRDEAEIWLNQVIDVLMTVEADLLRPDQPWGLLREQTLSDWSTLTLKTREEKTYIKH